MTNTVLVLGATGKTGRRLVPQLAGRGVNVRAASRKPGNDTVLFDWDRPETHDTVLAGAAAVYLVPPELVEDPTLVTGPFLERAKAAGVKRIVVLSSLGAALPNEDPESGRRRLERQVMASGIDWTLLRPSGFMQNFSEAFLLPGILNADAIATAAGNGAAGFVNADDIAAVAAVALTGDGHAGKSYAITGPHALSFADAVVMIGAVAGRPIAHRQISSEELTQILLSFGVPAGYAANVVVRDQEAIRDGFGALVTDTVERVTGRPPIRFADYASAAAGAWVRRAA